MTALFPLILLILIVASAIIGGLDKWVFEPKRKAANPKKPGKSPLLADYSRSLFWVFVLVFVIRSFVAEPYRIPSGSMLPDLQIGDFILVEKFAYNLDFPVFHWRLWHVANPKRGDVVVFHYPAYTNVDFIKRIIGLPGDHISYVKKQLFINGKKIPLTFMQKDYLALFGHRVAIKQQENLLGVKHAIYQLPWRPDTDFYNVVVPKGEYFVMGDDRDDSEDSRYWGFVPEKNFVGKAVLVWFSWDSQTNGVRWSRIGHVIHGG